MLVPDEGPKTAKIVVVGEAPGQREEQTGRPFVGPAGKRLAELFEEGGIARRRVYVGNVVQRRPPGNKIDVIPADELEAWVEDLHERLAELKAPHVIVPTGRVALEALIGRKVAIKKARGLLFEYEHQGRTVKVLPTLHPAFLFRDPSWTRACRLDWRKIGREAETPEWLDCEREHVVRPALDEVAEFLDEARHAERLSLDIETPGRRLTCIAFSMHPEISITVPLLREDWGRAVDHRQAVTLVRELCGLAVPKVMQNGLFDAYWLAQDLDCEVRNFRFDLMVMHHVLFPSEPHDLSYMASIDIPSQRYWKDWDAKEGEARKALTDRDALFKYNGIDACVQRELADVYWDLLRKRGLERLYLGRFANLFGPSLRLMLHGVGVNAGARDREHTRLQARCVAIRDELSEMAGRDLEAKKSISRQKFADWFYNELKVRKVRVRREGSKALATDEVTLRRHLLAAQSGRTRSKDPAVVVRAIELMLEHTRLYQLSTFLVDERQDSDGRVRSHYKPTTTTGRFSSTKTPKGTGMNLQNVDREIRHMFVPDAGCVFLKADLSQAESRVVYALTGDPKLVEIAQTPPWEFDVHRFNASIIFGKPEDEVTGEERYLAKRAVHAAHYGMHGGKLSEILLLDGIARTPDECQAMIDAYMEWARSVRQWQRDTRQKVLLKRPIVTSWGLAFDPGVDVRVSEDLFRQAYAFVPQSEVAFLLHQYGFVPLDAYIRSTNLASKINLHVYDELVVSCPLEEVWDVATFLRESLERPRLYGGVELVIPVEVGVGSSWKVEREWKRFPNRAELEGAAEPLLTTKAA